jgi:hypothetical protein
MIGPNKVLPAEAYTAVAIPPKLWPLVAEIFESRAAIVGFGVARRGTNCPIYFAEPHKARK